MDRVYVEITNICNLDCSFCPKTARKPRMMDENEFENVCKKIAGKTKFVYLHVMGEPLLHPSLSAFLIIAEKYALKVCITTNGTMLEKVQNVIIEHAKTIHRVSISLHCVEGNNKDICLKNYLTYCTNFVKTASALGIYCVFRLWNLDSCESVGKNALNSEITEFLHSEFGGEWDARWSGYRIAKNVFLEYAGTFVWPKNSELEPEDDGYCHGLIDQIAILCDGTVVPCCLDSEGKIALGNIFEHTLEEILSSPLVTSITQGFKERKMMHPLCKKCSYARRFR